MHEKLNLSSDTPLPPEDSPMGLINFGSLYLFIDKNSGVARTHNNLDLVEEFCRIHELDFVRLQSVLEYFGGYDDLEVLLNVQDSISADTVINPIFGSHFEKIHGEDFKRIGGAIREHLSFWGSGGSLIDRVNALLEKIGEERGQSGPK